MRKRICSVFVSLLLVLMLFSGCRSVGAVLKSNVSGLPYWYYEPDMNIGKDKVGMTAEGSSTSQRQAELLAYNNVIEKLAERTGSELSQEAYRELSVLGTITEYGLSIEDSFVMTQDGRYTVFLRVSMDRNLIELATTDESRRREALIKEVDSLIQSGDEYVKSGHEFNAASNYIKAMALAEGRDYISDEYKFDELYPVVIGLLQNMYISVINPHPEKASCVVSVSRRTTFASSVVASAQINARYRAEDSRGDIYEDYFVYVTGEEGQLVFNPMNDAIVRKGSVLFGLDLGDELDQLESAVGKDKVRELRELVDSKVVAFEYDKQYSMGSLAVAVIEHDELGYVTDSNAITDYMTSKFIKDRADAAVYYAEFDDEEDVYYEFSHSGRTEDCLLVLRIGITESFPSRNGVEVVGAEGIAFLFRTGTEEPVYKSDVIYSSAFAQTHGEAVQSAFRILADTAYTLVKAVYV